jgi:hypothetical protein
MNEKENPQRQRPLLPFPLVLGINYKETLLNWIIQVCTLLKREGPDRYPTNREFSEWTINIKDLEGQVWIDF